MLKQIEWGVQNGPIAKNGVLFDGDSSLRLSSNPFLLTKPRS